MVRSKGATRGALTGVGLGALIGLLTAAAVTYVPMVLEGQGFYESTDPLFAYGVVLGPLGAGVGGLWALARRPNAWTAGVRGWTLAAVAVFGALLVLLWQVFAVLTGAPSPF